MDVPLLNLRIVPILGRPNAVVTHYSVVAEVEMNGDLPTVVVASGVTERVANLIVAGHLAAVRDAFGGKATTIIDRDGNFAVWRGDDVATDLTWDEMLGQVATLTHPDIKQPRYQMRSAAQIAAEKLS